MSETEYGETIVRHVSTILAAIEGKERPVLLIDGRSGSGKTTLARAVAAAVPEAQLVRLDDLYPGWDGLYAASRMVVDDLLRSDVPGWRRWDWRADHAAEWHPIDPGRPLIIEGCGALSRAARARAALGVWVELDEATRRARALARDGDTYAPNWERWARQEDEFIRREQPRSLADVVLDETAVLDESEAAASATGLTDPHRNVG